MFDVIYRPDENYIYHAQKLQRAANGASIPFLTRYFHVEIPLRMQIHRYYFAMREADYKYPMNKKKNARLRQTMATPGVIVDNSMVNPSIFFPFSPLNHPICICVRTVCRAFCSCATHSLHYIARIS